jgi:hypothetical protein
MVRLYDGDTDAEIGQITEAQLEVLAEQLIEEALDEYSYNITAAAIGSLETNGADAEVVALLRRALGNRTSMEMRYDID